MVPQHSPVLKTQPSKKNFIKHNKDLVLLKQAELANAMSPHAISARSSSVLKAKASHV